MVNNISHQLSPCYIYQGRAKSSDLSSGNLPKKEVKYIYKILPPEYGYFGKVSHPWPNNNQEFFWYQQSRVRTCLTSGLTLSLPPSVFLIFLSQTFSNFLIFVAAFLLPAINASSVPTTCFYFTVLGFLHCKPSVSFPPPFIRFRTSIEEDPPDIFTNSCNFLHIQIPYNLDFHCSKVGFFFFFLPFLGTSLCWIF